VQLPENPRLTNENQKKAGNEIQLTIERRGRRRGGGGGGRGGNTVTHTHVAPPPHIALDLPTQVAFSPHYHCTLQYHTPTHTAVHTVSRYTQCEETDSVAVHAAFCRTTHAHCCSHFPACARVRAATTRTPAVRAAPHYRRTRYRAFTHAATTHAAIYHVPVGFTGLGLRTPNSTCAAHTLRATCRTAAAPRAPRVTHLTTLPHTAPAVVPSWDLDCFPHCSYRTHTHTHGSAHLGRQHTLPYTFTHHIPHLFPTLPPPFPLPCHAALPGSPCCPSHSAPPFPATPFPTLPPPHLG